MVPANVDMPIDCHLSFDPGHLISSLANIKAGCAFIKYLLHPAIHHTITNQRKDKAKQLNTTKNTKIMASIFTAKTFEPAAIAFGPVEKNSKGGRYIPIVDKNGTKTKITLQFPAMNLPFGISAYRDRPENDPMSYSVDLSFRGYETNENTLMLFNKLTALDHHLIDAAYANSVAWFGKQKSRELLEDTYRKLTKVDPSGKYAPIAKTKITMMNGKPNVQIFDTDKSKISIEDVPRGSTVKVIAELASVWFIGAGTSWGVTFRALQLLVTDKPNKMNDFAFVGDGDEENENMFDSE